MTLARLVLTAVSCCLLRPAWSAEPATGVPLTLSEALALARDHDPTLASARLQRAIDLAGLGVARERPNPELRYEHTNEAPHDLVSVAQPLEIGPGGAAGARRAHRLFGRSGLAGAAALDYGAGGG